MKKLLLSSLLLTQSLFCSETPRYRFSGQQAVDHLAETSECHHCDLSFQDLRAAIATARRNNPKKSINLSDSRLSFSFLEAADLSQANLTRAFLAGARLSQAKLSSANLTEADLFKADLTLANLEYARLFQAILYEANLTDANFTKATVSKNLHKYLSDRQLASLEK